MAIRPENHIVGDKAVRKISDTLIPEEWTISTPESDYGLDMLIEVVDHNKTTGKFFFIQSKGTADGSINGMMSYPLSVDRIKDYSKIQIPVLFVYYSKKEDRFWGRWMNVLYETLSEQQKNQETVTLHFTEANLLTREYLISIGEKISLQICSQVAIVAKKIPKEFSRFHQQIINLLKSYIGDDITENNCLVCQSLFLSYEGNTNVGTVTLSDEKEQLKIPLQLSSLDFLYYPFVRKDECPQTVLNIIFLIAFYVSSNSNLARNYVFSNVDKETIALMSTEKWIDLIKGISTEQFKSLMRLYDVALSTSNDGIAQMIIVLALSRLSKEDYQRIIGRYMDSVSNNRSKGVAFYNLANSMRNTDLYEAFSFYIMAYKYERLYKQRYYWWQELAGVLYMTRHYHFAELFYKKARRLDLKNCRTEIGILISDCLVCQGKFKDARKEECKYIEHGSVKSYVSILKCEVTGMMLEQHIDNIDSTFWFNQGILFSHENKFEKAIVCYLFAWRLNDWDMEALINAMFMAWNITDMDRVFLILLVVKELNPESGFRKIVSTVLSNRGDECIIDACKKILLE